ncbi:hypothetical protein HYH02_003844 [Chlamydomonas schloesseri]|uniref:RCK N-terminal domain-containing protein n=1 Tax=Chlamydomonas schloesseri TaxID=2026947 RepID=A0A836B8W9_9CHLO|nr:hypothetical protein HYH02_003844 [Chlamydomonas schloesseri]|eukprot:KAG2451237.1 hypothetical protein HYH02_003844 [Chlamydomonas schloesseri]
MLVPLGLDFLTFLSATVLVIPLFKSLKLSPVLGFLFSGVVLKQLGLFQDLQDTERLAELGVLFLLFEMGLELSLDRLKALAKYAFGLGSLQVLFCTGIFTAFALPAGHSIGTIFLEQVAHAPHRLVSIRSVDEAVVIGAALSMSSSAFVLQLLRERGEVTSKFGNATLGVLLFQDIAVVPFLVLLPLITTHGTDLEGASPVSLLSQLGPTALQTVAGLGALLLADRLIMKRIFEMVAQSRNSETFIALCLLTVAGTSLITQRLGLSDTMGAFLAGVLLSETSYRTQVEADIRPFKGLLLGLFFVTTGSSINLQFLQLHWQEAGWILAGLVTIKTLVVAAVGQLFGLTRSESIRTGFMLSQGGEFAFVLLSLANQLRILPTNLNQLLIIVVVLSMALTPFLAESGKVVANKLDELWPPAPRGSPVGGGGGAGGVPALAGVGPSTALPGGGEVAAGARARGGGGGGSDEAGLDHHVADPVVICGFSPAGQMVANMLESPLATPGGGGEPPAYLAFDMDPERVAAGRKAGFKVVWGDATRGAVLRAAGVDSPRAVAVCYADKESALQAVYTCRAEFPAVPIYACAADLRHAAELEEAGASRVIIRSVEAGLALGGALLGELGASEADLAYLKRGIEETVEARTSALSDWMHNNSEQVPAFSSLDMIVLTGEAEDIAREAAAAAAVAAAERDAQIAAALSAEAAQPAPRPLQPPQANGGVNGSANGSMNGSAAGGVGGALAAVGAARRSMDVDVVVDVDFAAKPAAQSVVGVTASAATATPPTSSSDVEGPAAGEASGAAGAGAGGPVSVVDAADSQARVRV